MDLLEDAGVGADERGGIEEKINLIANLIAPTLRRVEQHFLRDALRDARVDIPPLYRERYGHGQPRWERGPAHTGDEERTDEDIGQEEECCPGRVWST